MATIPVIEEKLTKEFQPTHLEVLDESGGCGDKIRVTVVSPKFEGMGLLERHQAVNKCIAEEVSRHGFPIEGSQRDSCCVFC